ncbi:MAG: MATE family efflux transporter [Anaerolineaceae bacterium]|nr:MATE family efflux transporter [Anaerolineaceae bacterium]MCY3907155.1 MATE family efflux transporter [Anaerolineaceae bacterium]
MKTGRPRATAPRKTLSLALQMAAEQTLLYGVILFDAVVAGQLGVDPLAAQVVVARLVAMTTVLFQITAIGGSILVAQAVGRGDRRDAGLILRSASLLSLAVGFALMLLLQAFSPQLMSLMGVSGAVGQLGTPYMRALALALPLQFLLLSANGCLRGAGDARRPLLVMGLANGLHVILALLLALAQGAGLTGLALAHFVSRAAGILLLAHWLWRGTGGLRWRGWRTSRRTMRDLLRLGTPVGLEQLAIRGAQLLQLRLVTELGVAALAAWAVTTHTLAIILMLGLGFLLAALTVTGQLTGAGQTELIYRSAWQLQRQAWLVLGGLALLFLAWPDVTRLFSGDELVRAAALPGLQLILLAVPLEAINQVLTGALRGAGDTRYPMWVTIVGHWLVSLPLIVLFTNVLGWGLNGVWSAMFLQMLLRALATGGRFWRRYHPRFASV